MAQSAPKTTTRKPAAVHATSATTFHTEDTALTPRPTATITIGSHKFTARAPKMPLWMDAGFLWERVEQVRVAQERLASEVILIAAEKRRLQQIVEQAPSAHEIHGIFIDGFDDGGRWKGGFLRRCLPADNYATLVAELDDEDSELDLPEIYDAALALYREFEPWFLDRANAMGLAVPDAAAEAKPAR